MGNKFAACPISDLLPEVLHQEDLEMIEVPAIPGNGIILLRVKSMPKIAFVLWNELQTSTLSQVAFHLQPTATPTKERYSVVCACCPSERYYVTENDSEEGREELFQQLNVLFKVALEDACRRHGIQVLVMRKAGRWIAKYGHSWLSIVEAVHHRETFAAFYPEAPLDSLDFIDYEKSKGMRPEDVTR